jgi:hypothetical protein
MRVSLYGWLRLDQDAAQSLDRGRKEPNGTSARRPPHTVSPELTGMPSYQRSDVHFVLDDPAHSVRSRSRGKDEP